MDDPLPKDLVPAWREFLAEPRTLDDLFAHPILFPLQRRREMERMFDRIVLNEANWFTEAPQDKLKPLTYMEIGADKGGSVWAWLNQFPEIERCIVNEIRGTPYREEFERAFPRVKFLWLPQSSYDAGTVHAVGSWLGTEPIDVLFIDGDKNAFLTDYNYYSLMVRKGGTVFLHDVVDDGPKRAWEALVTRLKGEGVTTIVDRSEAEEACERERQSIPPANPHEGWLRHWRGRSCTVGVVQL